MAFHGSVNACNRYQIVLRLCVLLILGCFVVFTGWPGFVAFIIWLSWGIWDFVTKKTWSVEVADGQVSWDPNFPIFARRSVPASEIVAIDGNLDEKHNGITLQLKDGRRRFPYVPFPIDPDAFVAAVIAENPNVADIREHRGHSS
jgi:hypothetical protein